MKIGKTLLLCLGCVVLAACGTRYVGPLDSHCSPDPPTSTPWPVQATYTPRPTYTPNLAPTETSTSVPTDTPTATCPPTATTIVWDTPTPYPTSTPYPVGTPGAVIWFEEGFENLTAPPRGGPCADIPASYGPFDYVEQGMGCPNYFPDLNIIELDHSLVHDGGTSLRFEMNRQGLMDYEDRRINVGIEWDKHIPSSEAWVSVWLFLPRDFTAAQWITVLDFRQSGRGKWYVWLVDRPGGTYAVFSSLWYNRPVGAIDPASVRATHPIPKGRWVRLQAYYRRHLTDGQIILWHDTEAGGPDTEVLRAGSFTSYVPEYSNMLIHLRYYSHYGPNTMNWDDFVVADRWVERGYAP